jgi:hypothetical protein
MSFLVIAGFDGAAWTSFSFTLPFNTPAPAGREVLAARAKGHSKVRARCNIFFGIGQTLKSGGETIFPESLTLLYLIGL